MSNKLMQNVRDNTITREEKNKIIQKSKSENNFKFFLAISDFFEKNFYYYYNGKLNTEFYVDFKFILKLSRYYKKMEKKYHENTIVFLKGHLYEMQNIIKKYYSISDAWEHVKLEWENIMADPII